MPSVCAGPATLRRMPVKPTRRIVTSGIGARRRTTRPVGTRKRPSCGPLRLLGPPQPATRPIACLGPRKRAVRGLRTGDRARPPVASDRDAPDHAKTRIDQADSIQTTSAPCNEKTSLPEANPASKCTHPNRYTGRPILRRTSTSSPQNAHPLQNCIRSSPNSDRGTNPPAQNLKKIWPRTPTSKRFALNHGNATTKIMFTKNRAAKAALFHL